MLNFVLGVRLSSGGAAGECRIYAYDASFCCGSNARGAGAAYGESADNKKAARRPLWIRRRGPRQPPLRRHQLKNSLALSNQPLSVGLCLSPPFLSDSSSSFMSLRWCSVSLTGVSTRTWQYRSPG